MYWYIMMKLTVSVSLGRPLIYWCIYCMFVDIQLTLFCIWLINTFWKTDLVCEDFFFSDKCVWPHLTCIRNIPELKPFFRCAMNSIATFYFIFFFHGPWKERLRASERKKGSRWPSLKQLSAGVFLAWH